MSLSSPAYNPSASRDTQHPSSWLPRSLVIARTQGMFAGTSLCKHVPECLAPELETDIHTHVCYRHDSVSAHSGTHACLHFYAHAGNAHLCVHAHSLTVVHSYTHAHVQTHMYTYAHVHTLTSWANPHRCSHTRIHTNPHTDTHAHSHLIITF